MTKADLQSALHSLGLDSKGNKKVLLQRLEEHSQQQQQPVLAPEKPQEAKTDEDESSENAAVDSRVASKPKASFPAVSAMSLPALREELNLFELPWQPSDHKSALQQAVQENRDRMIREERAADRKRATKPSLDESQSAANSASISLAPLDSKSADVSAAVAELSRLAQSQRSTLQARARTRAAPRQAGRDVLEALRSDAASWAGLDDSDEEDDPSAESKAFRVRTAFSETKRKQEGKVDSLVTWWIERATDLNGEISFERYFTGRKWGDKTQSLQRDAIVYGQVLDSLLADGYAPSKPAFAFICYRLSGMVQTDKDGHRKRAQIIDSVHDSDPAMPFNMLLAATKAAQQVEKVKKVERIGPTSNSQSWKRKPQADTRPQSSPFRFSDQPRGNRKNIRNRGSAANRASTKSSTKSSTMKSKSLSVSADADALSK